MSYIMNVSVTGDASKCLSIEFDDINRQDIIKRDVMLVIDYVNGRLTDEDFDPESLCPEVQATLAPLN